MSFMMSAPPEARAGDLNPPTGAIAATNRIPLNSQAITLPYTIASSGSYVLTSDLTGVVGQSGLVIAADNVTIDLNGFSLIGVAGSFWGIEVSGTRKGICVMNGVVRDWGRTGVYLSNSTNNRARNLRAHNNGVNGMHIGKGSVIDGCTASENDDNGFRLEGDSIIADCAADSNVDAGIGAGFGCTIIRCSARGNGGQGILAEAQLLNGVLTSASITVVGCTANANEQTGISPGVGSTVRECTARANGFDGISVGNGSAVIDCTAEANTNDGIGATFGSTVSGCTARNNDDGIRVSGGAGGTGCRVVGNSCDSNGFSGDGVGISVGGVSPTHHHVSGNHVTDNDRGIDVQSTGNIVIGNTASGNTDAGVFPAPHFVIDPGNSPGEALDVSAAAITTGVVWRNLAF
jgi:parallel beta-helix repeat protein